MQKGILDQVSQRVQMPVIFSRLLAVFSRRDVCFYTLFARLFDNGIAVIPLVGEQVIGMDSLDQVASLCTIRFGT